MVVEIMKRFRDFIKSAWEWITAIAWWLLAVGLIVLVSVIEHLVIVI